MTRPRRAARLIGLLLASAVLGAACVSVIGADEEPLDVAEQLCKCDQLFKPKPVCVELVRSRLEGATEATRAAWMTKYANECANCNEPLQCFQTEPTCTGDNRPCSYDGECCSFREDVGPACVDKKCVAP